MTKKALSDAITNISTEYIEKAADYTVTKKVHQPVWVKWAAMAACLCVVLIGAATIYIGTQNGQASKSKAPTVLIGEEEYTICGTAGEAMILERCGLPAELSAELAGELIAYLDYDGECYYTMTEKMTEIAMFEYEPETTANVYIVLIDGEYYAAIRRDGEGFHGINGNNLLLPA